MRRSSADPQRAQQGATAAAAAPAALESLSSLQRLADASPRVAQLRRLQALADAHYAPVSQLAATPEEEERVHGNFASAEVPPQRQQAPRAYNTGLPDQLKSGIESLSGLSITETGRLVDRRDVRPIQMKGAAPVTQRVLDISSSKSNRNPYHELKHADFQSLNRRKHLGLSIPSWLWLKRLAQSQYKVIFSTWKEAITAYSDYEKMKVQLSKPQPIKSGFFRYGASVPDPLSMNDAHGIVGMGDSIQDSYPVNSSTFVSPGGSADFFGADMRMRGANVVDIPLSRIKDDNLKDGQRAHAVTFIKSCFKGNNIATNIVIFDAIISGSALRLLKELIAEALSISEQRIHLLALNNPPSADGKKFIRDGHASHITDENRSHVKYVKKRIEYQDYKYIGRKYPKNPVGNLTAKTAGRKLAEDSGMNAKLMAILFAMHEVAAKDFVEAEDSSDDDEE